MFRHSVNVNHSTLRACSYWTRSLLDAIYLYSKSWRHNELDEMWDSWSDPNLNIERFRGDYNVSVFWGLLKIDNHDRETSRNIDLIDRSEVSEIILSIVTLYLCLNLRESIFCSSATWPGRTCWRNHTVYMILLLKKKQCATRQICETLKPSDMSAFPNNVIKLKYDKDCLDIYGFN